MSRLVLVLLVSATLLACKKKEEATGAATGTASGTAVATGAATGTATPTPPPPQAIDAAVEEPPVEAARAPTPDEIDRCGRLHAVTLACGIAHDHEFGWVKADVKKLTRDESQKACTIPAITDEDGMSAFPVPILEEEKVKAITIAALDDCAKVKQALDEHSPGKGPAGYDPSK